MTVSVSFSWIVSIRQAYEFLHPNLIHLYPFAHWYTVRFLLSCVDACAETAKGLLRSASTNRIDSGYPVHDSDTRVKQLCV
jgi:hypothetical protein